MSSVRSPRMGGERRRPHPLLLGVAAASALLLLLAWTRYDPVVRGEGGWCPEGSVLVPAGGAEAGGAEVGDAGAGDGEDGVGGVVCTLANTDARAVAFAAAVRNDGPLPLRVRAVRLRGEVQGVLRVDEVRMAPRRGADVDARELVAFRPFRLGAGEQRIVEVRGSLVPCAEVTGARAATFRALPLRTTVFRLPHDSAAPLDPPVRLIAEPCR